MPAPVDPKNIRWWEKEPLLIHDVLMVTEPGRTWRDPWQADSDGSEEADIHRVTGALQMHSTNLMAGHITNQYCYFRSTHFKEQRSDYLARLVDKAHARGVRLIVYFNVHAVRPDFGADKPAWRQVRFDGTPIDGIYGVETSMCVNTGFRDWVRDVCLDLCEYPIDGIFFDGPVIFSNCCYCETCQRLYRKAHGGDMPQKVPREPGLRPLAAFQAESLRRFLEHSQTAIKAVRPDVLLYCNAGKRGEPAYIVGRGNRILIQSQDVLAAEGGFVYGQLSTQPVWIVGSNTKYYRTQAGGKPTGAFISAAHGPWRAYPQTEPEMRLAVAQAPVHGCGAYFAGFKRSYATAAFRKVGEDYRFYAKHRDCFFNTRSKARTAILWPDDAVSFYGAPSVSDGDFTQGGEQADVVGDIHEEFNGFYDVLLRSHVPCDILDEESVRRQEHAGHDLLVLPNAACTDPAFDEAIRSFVRAGGNVIASFETSLCDADGRRAKDFSLADVFGVHVHRTPLKPFPHFYFFRQDDQPELFGEMENTLLPAPMINSEVTLAGAEMISPYSAKFKGWDGSVIEPGPFPAITINRFGKGRVIYLAGTFGGQFWGYKQRDIRLLLRNLLYLLGERDVQLENAPDSVEVAHYESKDGAREMVQLINYTGGLTRPFEEIRTLPDLRVRIRSPRSRVRALRLDMTPDTRREGEWLTVSLPRLELFETLVLE